MRSDARRLIALSLAAIAILCAQAVVVVARESAKAARDARPVRAKGAAPRAIDETALRGAKSKPDADAAEAPPEDESETMPQRRVPAEEPADKPAEVSDATAIEVVEETPEPAAPAESAVAPAESADPRLEAPSFKGVLPGTTTREELHAKWGTPGKTERIPGGTRETYESDAFEYVRVTVDENVVSSVTLRLKQAMEVDAVVQGLHVGDVEPAMIYDDEGHALGQTLPEKGMLFGFDPQAEGPRILQIVIEPIDDQPFLARAEARLANNYGGCLSDVRQALALAPRSGRAYWLRACALLRCGDFGQALTSAEKAIELEPGELEYRLTLSKIMCETGDYRQAVQQARDVADAASAAPITLARAFCQWGDCVAAAPERDYAEALTHHMRAVELAQPLATGAKPPVRRAAKEVLVDAYLGAARDIGHGRWQHQATVVPKWLERALALADDIVAVERGDRQVRLHVFEEALAALASITEPPDAAQWIQGASELGATLVKEAADPAHKAALAWRLGVALGDATEIEAARSAPDAALRLGKLATEYLQLGDAAAQQSPTHDYLRGWVCFRMGAILVAEKSDHKQALSWFEQAVPLLESPAPASAAVHPGRHGETFVSMAVSYWELGQRSEALRLTEQGLKLMEQAASDGQLGARALAVPYGNLARMHELLGDTRQAKKYSDMAARVQARAGR